MKPLIRCYDNGGESVDRDTVLFMNLPEGRGLVTAVAMSADPFHAQGFGQHTTVMPGSHLGERIRFSDLPADCQRFVMQDIRDINTSTGKRPMGL